MPEELCQMDMLKRQLSVRWMVRADMARVNEIEGHSFDDPWSEESILSLLRTREAIGMVAELNDEVVGFMIYLLHPSRLHLARIGVRPDNCRTGVGRVMIDKLKAKLSAERRSRITVNVVETNLPMHLFLRGMGFRAVGVNRDPDLCDYYQFRFSVA